jgi:hypothetical protein
VADAKLPDGYDDEASFIAEARERFTSAESYDRENRDAAIDDLKFLSGDQWDPTTYQNRISQGRPCLTINQLPQFVAQVVGDIRINRPSIKVRPAEDGDEDIAEVRQGLIRAIEQQNRASLVYAQAGQMQTACGIGNFRIGLDYAGDETFDRDITISLIPDPLAVVWDPLSVEPTGKDARYCFVIDEMPRKDFEAKYKDAQPSALAESQSHSGWFQKDVVRVTEYWIIKETPVQMHQLSDGSVIKGGKPKKLPEGVTVLQSRETVRRSACLYVINGQEILEGPIEIPISRVPVFRCEGWTLTVEGRRHRWGLVRFAKDPARLKNYWRSTVAETLSLQPKSVWAGPVSAVEGREDQIRNAHRSGDPLIVWNDGTQGLERVAPPPYPAALAQEAANCTQDIKDVTGLHDASLGAQSNETSGRAIMARDRQGDVATYIYPDNLKEAISECGRVINDLIPVVYDTARTIRILGDDEAPKVQRINDPTHPDSVDLNVGKYDVVVETGPSYSTKRVESAESMMQFVQAVPQAAAVAADLIAKAQDWPMAEAIGERLQKMLPPQLQDPPKTPEEAQQVQAQAEQAAQQAQMQQRALGADLTLKNAQAAKAEAEAGLAQFQLSQATGQVQQMVAQQVAAMLLGQGMAPPGQPAPPAGPGLGQ